MRKVIERYFKAWLVKDSYQIESLFSDDAIYSECYGPIYLGKHQILKWFEAWNNNGTVMRWDIKQFIEHKNTLVVEWYFECNYKGVNSAFDGVSIVEFDNNNKIKNLKEFQSKSEHDFPYGNSI